HGVRGCRWDFIGTFRNRGVSTDTAKVMAEGSVHAMSGQSLPPPTPATAARRPPLSSRLPGWLIAAIIVGVLVLFAVGSIMQKNKTENPGPKLTLTEAACKLLKEGD